MTICKHNIASFGMTVRDTVAAGACTEPGCAHGTGLFRCIPPPSVNTKDRIAGSFHFFDHFITGIMQSISKRTPVVSIRTVVVKSSAIGIAGCMGRTLQPFRNSHQICIMKSMRSFHIRCKASGPNDISLCHFPWQAYPRDKTRHCQKDTA